MAKPIPKWVQERFSILWQKYDNQLLTYEEIEKVLKLDDRNTISVFLNELKKAEWVDIQLSDKDLRKRTYTLKAPNQIMLEMTKSDDNTRSKS